MQNDMRRPIDVTPLASPYLLFHLDPNRLELTLKDVIWYLKLNSFWIGVFAVIFWFLSDSVVNVIRGIPLLFLWCVLWSVYVYPRFFVKRKDVDELFFITGRDVKFHEMQELFHPVKLIKKPLVLPTLEHVGEDNIAEVASYRLAQAYKILKSPCMIEEGGLFLNIPGAARSFPGHYFKEIVEDQYGILEFAKAYDGVSGVIKSALAYTEDGITFKVFTNQVSGRVQLPEKLSKDSDGWEHFWVPWGFSNTTLADLDHRNIKSNVSVRAFPATNLRGECFFQETFSGVYELHLTLANSEDDPRSSTEWYQKIANDEIDENVSLVKLGVQLEPSEEWVNHFKAACEEIKVKPLVIGMDNPRKPTQLQTAEYVSCKSISHAEQILRKRASQFAESGVPVVRLRAEAMLHNPESPKTDLEARDSNPQFYFEFHARVGYLDENGRQMLEDLSKKYTTEDKTIILGYSTVGGSNRYFINMRNFSGRPNSLGSTSALLLWREILQHLKDLGNPVEKEVKPEYAVFDNMPLMDYKFFG